MIPFLLDIQGDNRSCKGIQICYTTTNLFSNKNTNINTFTLKKRIRIHLCIIVFQN